MAVPVRTGTLHHSGRALKGAPLDLSPQGCGGAAVAPSYRCAKEVLDLGVGALVDELGDAAAVAAFRVALVAQQAEAPAGFGQRRERVELLARLGRLEMLLEDAKQLAALAGARGEPALLRRAERAQVQVADAALVEPGGELALGEAGPPRGGDGAHVDHQVDLGVGELVEHRPRGGVLVADGEERFCHAPSLADVAARAYANKKSHARRLAVAKAWRAHHIAWIA
jgi:hypothetical protein